MRKERFIFNALPRNINDFMQSVENALRAISNHINTDDVQNIPVLTKEPQYVQEGMLCICDGVGFNPLNDGSKRLVIYIDNNWKEVV